MGHLAFSCSRDATKFAAERQANLSETIQLGLAPHVCRRGCNRVGDRRRIGGGSHQTAGLADQALQFCAESSELGVGCFTLRLLEAARHRSKGDDEIVWRFTAHLPMVVRNGAR